MSLTTPDVPKGNFQKAQTKRELMQMKHHSAKEIRAKGNIESKRDIKNKIKKMAIFNGNVQRRKMSTKRNLAKQQEKTMRIINYAAAVLRHPP